MINQYGLSFDNITITVKYDLMQFIAMIGDIVDSKQMDQRNEFQVKLRSLLKALGNRNPALISPYTITLGDEFQAVYKSADRLFLDIFSILREVHPQRVRFAIGVGVLTTEVNRKQALGMDGPAFHRARESMIQLKKSSYLIRLQGTPLPAGPDFDPWRLFNHSLNLLSHKVAAWEGNRLHILCGLFAGQRVGDLAQELGISKVAVYKNINAGALEEFKGLCTEITRFLNRELKSP